MTTAAAVLWVALLLALRPEPIIALLLMIACGVVGAFGGRVYLRRKREQRIAAFREQLEGALRTLSGAVRVGLGIRQALVLTSEQSREPAKTEFMRVVALSNLGMSVLDAFDQLALRMVTPETAVLARVIRVQSQTGGDLGSVLEGLAGTIRDRRRLRRRVSAITAQGRATAWLLGLLPLAVGLFVLSQADLRAAMLDTLVGRVVFSRSRSAWTRWRSSRSGRSRGSIRDRNLPGCHRRLRVVLGRPDRAVDVSRAKPDGGAAEKDGARQREVGLRARRRHREDRQQGTVHSRMQRQLVEAGWYGVTPLAMVLRGIGALGIGVVAGVTFVLVVGNGWIEACCWASSPHSSAGVSPASCWRAP